MRSAPPDRTGVYGRRVPASTRATAAGTDTALPVGANRGPVPERVERTDPDGVDFGWVMQTTFVLTIAGGAPLVAALSTTRTLPTWTARAEFAVRVGAVVWLCTALAVFWYARTHRGAETETDRDQT